jgi:hypothetical protein
LQVLIQDFLTAGGVHRQGDAQNDVELKDVRRRNRKALDWIRAEVSSNARRERDHHPAIESVRHVVAWKGNQPLASSL